jgi:hypothetical protein
MNDQENKNAKSPENNEGFIGVYKDAVKGKNLTRAWSVASFVLGIFSIVCCCTCWAGLVAGILAIIFAVVSRRALGYFDGMSLSGLITAIFGVVFSLLMICMTYVYMKSPEFVMLYEEIMKKLIVEANP